MAAPIWGIVHEGKVIPEAPLPEGLAVQIVVPEGPPEVTPELQEEFDAWARSSAQALAMVEELADKDENRADR